MGCTGSAVSLVCATAEAATPNAMAAAPPKHSTDATQPRFVVLLFISIPLIASSVTTRSLRESLQ